MRKVIYPLLLIAVAATFVFAQYTPTTREALDASESEAGAVADSTTQTATETALGIHKTVIAIAADSIVMDGTGSAPWGTVKLYDFPAGVIHVLSVMVDDFRHVSFGGECVTTDGGDFSLGTTGTSDATIDGTDVNLLASTSVDPIGTAVDAVQVVDAVAIDGTSTAADLYLNCIIDDADVGAVSHTNTVSGTVTITWMNAGDK